MLPIKYSTHDVTTETPESNKSLFTTAALCSRGQYTINEASSARLMPSRRQRPENLALRPTCPRQVNIAIIVSQTRSLLNSQLIARQDSAGILMLCRCYFLSYSSSSFLNDRLKQRDLGNYKTGLHQISRDGIHVGVDVQFGIGFRIGQRTLPWQPLLGAKSAEIGDMPSFLGLAFHNGWQYGKADGSVNSTEVRSTSTSCNKLVNFGPLTP